MTDRRTFLKGLFAGVAATPLVKFTARVADRAIQPVRAAVRWMWPKPLLNSGAWDPRYRTWDEAKKASDKIADEIVGRVR